MEKNEIKKLSQELIKQQELNELESQIQSNNIEFEYDNKFYRVCYPVYRDTKQVEKAIRQKFNELLNDKSYKIRETIIKETKENKGIDLVELESKNLDLQLQINQIFMDITMESNDVQKKKLRSKVLDLQEQILINYNQINQFTQFSLQDALLEYKMEYNLFLLLEQQIDNKWEKVFKTYEEMLNIQDIRLLTLATKAVTNIINK